MANKQISQLDIATTALSSDYLIIDNSIVTKRITTTDFLNTTMGPVPYTLVAATSSIQPVVGNNTASGCYSSILGGSLNTILSSATSASIIAGNNIVALSANTAYMPRIALTNIPTISAGLGSGFVWRNTSTNQLFIVP